VRFALDAVGDGLQRVETSRATGSRPASNAFVNSSGDLRDPPDLPPAEHGVTDDPLVDRAEIHRLAGVARLRAERERDARVTSGRRVRLPHLRRRDPRRENAA
jgi:hypothetical protein